CYLSIIYTLTFFFFNDTSTSEIYTLSLHDALPISVCLLKVFAEVFRTFNKASKPFKIASFVKPPCDCAVARAALTKDAILNGFRSEEHTSELQSRFDLVCRLLLEKKK